ncbi:hypothetical protein ACFWG0_15920 [Streptomyces yangpuensis]
MIIKKLRLPRTVLPAATPATADGIWDDRGHDRDTTGPARRITVGAS